MPRILVRAWASPIQVLLLSIVIGFANPLFAQSKSSLSSYKEKSTIEGVVELTEPQGKPVALQGILVKLTLESPVSGPLTALTDSVGHFKFEHLPVGRYHLEVHSEGFIPFDRELVVGRDEMRVEEIRLQIEKVVQKVEVRDRADLTQMVGNAPRSTTFDSRQILRLPLAQEKFKEALPLVPGVVRTHDGKLHFKGESENQGMLLVNSAETVDPVTGNFSIPVPVDDVQEVKVSKGPYDAQYGDFTGGLTTVSLKPPPGQWKYGVMDFLPGLRGKSGHLVGISDETPRMFLGGPILKNRINFSEALTYEVRKTTVRGLPWPKDETKTQGFSSLTSFQVILSPRHLLSLHFNGFSQRNQFDDINSLVSQAASSDLGDRGFSVGANDAYQFNSGALLTTIFHFTRFDSNAHGQGPEDMLVTPNGWGGNFFNTWDRSANEYEGLSIFQFPRKEWDGVHRLKVGVDFNHRSYRGLEVTHPIKVLREVGSLAERINFLDAGLLGSRDSEVAEFVQDHWMLNDHLAVDLGGRLLNQSIGRSVAFSPRAGLVYSPGVRYKTMIRAGVGLFYGPVPLLASDFNDNPARILTYFDEGGVPLGPAVTLVSANLRVLPDGEIALAGRGIHPSPRNSTWNIELDRQISSSTVLSVSYLYSRTRDLFIEAPYIGALGTRSFLGLTPTGGSHYHEFEATLCYKPGERDELNISYVHSRARGSLNSLDGINVPFEQPVIRPNVTSELPSDIPNRLLTWGVLHFPWKLTASPVFDVHTGFPYSNFDVLQQYVGEPNGARFPTFLSLDLKVYRTFKLPLPFLRNRKIRLGLYSLNLTNHSNPYDVYSDIASQHFGDFAGFRHRVNGFVIDVVE
ncbi:MAG TPA: hypothetical protein VFZ27_19120 [Terriglobia bacterium]|nr:hypothetical protein [Terriglobia bacterium]